MKIYVRNLRNLETTMLLSAVQQGAKIEWKRVQAGDDFSWLPSHLLLDLPSDKNNRLYQLCVRMTDATIILCQEKEQFRMERNQKYCVKEKKPCLINPSAKTLTDFLTRHRVKTLNIVVCKLDEPLQKEYLREIPKGLANYTKENPGT